jgi:hypothetical protein
MKAKTFLLVALLFMPHMAYAEHPPATKPILSDVVGAFDQVLKCQAIIKIVVYYTDIYQVYKTELEKVPPNKQASKLREKLIKDWTTFESTSKDFKIWLQAHGFDAQAFERRAFITYQKQILTQIINDVHPRFIVLNSLNLTNLCNSTIDELGSILDVEGGIITPEDNN